MSPVGLLVVLGVVVAVTALAPGAGAASTTLVINEVDYDQPSTDTAEFLELKNVSSAAINLDPYSLEFVNGNAGGAAVYRTFELPEVALAAGDYYVVCANPATTAELRPRRRSGDGSDPERRARRARPPARHDPRRRGELRGGYGRSLHGGLRSQAHRRRGAAVELSRCTDGSDTDPSNDVDFILRPVTPGAPPQLPAAAPPFGECGDREETRVHDIQGNGAVSPGIRPFPFVIEGVVAADFQGSEGLEASPSKQEHADADADPNTSEGLFALQAEARRRCR